MANRTFNIPKSKSTPKRVKIADTIKGFREIVEGKHDEIPEQAFLLMGTIEQVLERAEQMKKEAA